MVKEENAHYHTVNKFVVSFLNASKFATPELIDEWKTKFNLHKLKSALKQTDRPRYPPRPKSEYLFYCDEVRPLIRGLHIHKVTCELGRMWKEFQKFPDPEMKKRITELAEADKKRYYIAKEAMQKKETKNDNHLRSKYLYFCKEERDKNPKITLSNIAVLWASNKTDDKLADRYEAAKKAVAEAKKTVAEAKKTVTAPIEV